MRLDTFTPPGRLRWELAQGTAIHRLQELRHLHAGSPLRTHVNWNETRRWLEEVGHRRRETDVVLQPVLAAAKAAPDELWHDVALFLFWRPLVVCRRRLSRLDDGDATVEDLPDATLDTEILWAFLAVLHRIDLDARRDRIGLKILNDVQHDVRLSYRKEHGRLAAHLPLVTAENDDEEGVGIIAPGAEDDEFAAAELRHDAEWARAYLKAMARSGRITGPDYLILIGCYLYGHSLDEMAARLGMSYDAVRKRRQRALKIFQKDVPRPRGKTP